MCVIQWSGTGILGWLYFRNALKEVRVVPYNPFSSRAASSAAAEFTARLQLYLPVKKTFWKSFFQKWYKPLWFEARQKSTSVYFCHIFVFIN